MKTPAVLGLELDMKPSEKTEFAESDSIYELRLYDNILMTFAFKKNDIGELSVKILFVDKGAKHQLPLDMDEGGDGLLDWLSHRVIPKNRTFVEKILATFGLAYNDVKGIIDVCMGLSLNDSYWVIPQGFHGKFAEYNLYENRFSEALALVAYTGVGSTDGVFTTSPELTTNGMLPKAWRFMDNAESGGIYLYKGGTVGAANTGNEPFAEFYAYQIAQAMGLDAVPYDLENWKGILASKCKLFTDINTAYIPIGRIVKRPTLTSVFEYYEKLGTTFAEHIRSMLVFDAVIHNTDRHFGNFGVLRDNRTGRIIAPAPIFDNGMSLFHYAMKDDIQHLDEYAKTRPPAYPGTTWVSICQKYMGNEQRVQLRKLIGFTFTRHPTINWEADRLSTIEKYIQKRVPQLIELA
jgi:hypothetical protein